MISGDLVAGLISRRGSIIGWSHAIPPPPTAVDDDTRGPRLTLGGPRESGAYGEDFTPFYNITALLSGKNAAALLKMWGAVEAGDMQLDVAVPFESPDCDAPQPPPDLITAFNAGQFAQILSSPTTMVFDKFSIYGDQWVAKAKPVPLIDANAIFAWRLLITRDSV